MVVSEFTISLYYIVISIISKSHPGIFFRSSSTFLCSCYCFIFSNISIIVDHINTIIVNKNKTIARTQKSISVMKPYGVWAIISPFNFPAAIFVGMNIGAIITGKLKGDIIAQTP